MRNDKAKKGETINRFNIYTVALICGGKLINNLTRTLSPTLEYDFSDCSLLFLVGWFVNYGLFNIPWFWLSS